MNIPWGVLWWKTREEMGKRWIGLAAGAVLAFVCVLGWVSAVTNHAAPNQEDPNLASVARWTAIYFVCSLLVATALGFVLVLRGHLKGWIATTVAERSVIGVARTLLGLSAIGIALGIVIYGGDFLHIEIFLKLLHRE